MLVIWLVIFAFRKGIRKEMFLVSLFTMPFGLTEPLFVPEYWSPPSLFNLATLFGFDIESLIFSFSIGGIGSVLYESLFNKIKHKKMNEHEINNKRHRFHLIAVLSPVIVFLILFYFTKLNPIYSAIVAMFVGGISAVICRPDLKKKTFFGGVLFLVLYFLFFLAFNITYPYAVERFWNLTALSGVLIFGIPIEELLFAFAFGLMWSSIYEHILYYKIKEKMKGGEKWEN